jgi:hypothetical protein
MQGQHEPLVTFGATGVFGTGTLGTGAVGADGAGAGEAVAGVDVAGVEGLGASTLGGGSSSAFRTSFALSAATIASMAPNKRTPDAGWFQRVMVVHSV